MRKTILMTFALLCIWAQGAWAQLEIKYIEHGWDEATKTVTTTTKSEFYPLRLGKNVTNDYTLQSWHYAEGDCKIKSLRVPTGECNIILLDGATLNTVIHFENENGRTGTLRIFAQSEGENMGRLIADARSMTSVDCAGIGGSEKDSFSPAEDCGTVIIHGGNITAYGAEYGAGIGGADGGNGGTVIIYGGKVTTDGGIDAAGIGGGEGGNGGTVTIYGGEVYADGTGWGAGIGGGEDGDGATVKIYGGKVTACAGSDAGSKNGSAIGSEDGDGHRGSLTIGDNMMVHAGQDASDANGHLFSYGERVPACYFRPYARIEPCTHQGKTYTINGTTATGTHKLNCSHCLDRTEETHTFDDNNTCTVCGVSGAVNAVNIYLPEAEYTDGHYASAPRTQTVVTGTTITLPAPPVTYLPNGVEFAGWAVGTPTSLGITSYWKGESESILTAGSSYQVSADVNLTARYKGVSITLADATDNGETLYQNNSKTAQTVTLSGRTLYKDGAWNTLCLPFSMTAEQVSSDLAGATLMTLKESSFDRTTGELALTFEDATSIEAGKPYIVKWASDNSITSPVFNSVVINSTPAPVTTDYIDFIGTFSPEVIYRTVESENESVVTDRTYLYLSDSNTLYYPESVDFKVNAFRAYFKLKNNLTASPNPSEGGETNSVRSFHLNFGDETTGITITNSTNDTNSDGAWFSIDGRRLTGKPTARGLYIRSTSGSLQGKNHGKKVIIK